MTGKVPDLPPQPIRIRSPGVMITYYSPFYKKWIVRKWPRGNGGDTPGRKRSRADFIAAVHAIKNAAPEEIEGAEALTRFTPFLVRDALMSASFGLLFEYTDANGVTWKGTRTVTGDIQYLLDTITNEPGSIIFRTGSGWVGLPPGTALQLLRINADLSSLEWTDPPAEEHNIPAGGTSGQVLEKNSDTDYDVEWATPSGGGGGGLKPYVITLSGGATVTVPDDAGAITLKHSGGVIFSCTLEMPATPTDGQTIFFTTTDTDYAYFYAFTFTANTEQTRHGFSGPTGGISGQFCCCARYDATLADWTIIELHS